MEKLNYSNYEKRLIDLGFSNGDLQMLADRGYSPADVNDMVSSLLNAGLTNEAYARETFEEAYPELFSGCVAVLDAVSTLPEMRYDKNGKLKNEISNYVCIMKSDHLYDGIRYNEMTVRPEVHVVDGDSVQISSWTDADEAQSMMHIEERYGIYSREKHSAALRILFRERRYNPIQDIVNGLVWDGKDRCEHFLHEWAKVDDNAYTREVSRLIFAGGINRLYRPGCKFDDVPLLMGAGGSGKTALTYFLAINDDYRGDLKTMEGQQAIEDLQGKWILEIPEMSAFTKAKDQEAVKAFVSRQRDQYRLPYDRNPTELLRRCIFIGTTNDLNPLVDKTGNRRWYPVEVKCNGYDIGDKEQEIREYALQCWAEAKAKLGTKAMQPFANRELVKVIEEAQENAMQDDWRVGAISMFLDRKNPGELTCVREVCHMALSPNPDIPKEPTIVESKDIGKILNKMKGWDRVGVQRMAMYGPQRCWRKRDDAQVEKGNIWED